MKRFLAPLFGLLLASAAHAQSGLLPANQVWAGPPSGGQGFARARALVSADLPALAPGGLSLASGQIMVGQVSGFAGAVALSGDCTVVASGATTCTKTNGTAFSALATTTPGTGVATALGVAVGSAGSVVVNGGVLGTPSSGVGTNLTALNASNLSSGTVAAARGGAGAITGALKGSGAGVVTQAACADLSNAAASCATDTTVASNITSGTLPTARLGGLSNITASLGADVLLNNTASYFPGPAVAQGTAGTWYASGTVTFIDTGSAAGFLCKLWDGTTIISSGRADSSAANGITALSLSGVIVSPAANIRIDCRDAVATTGKMLFNASGNGKDSTITAFRIN